MRFRVLLRIYISHVEPHYQKLMDARNYIPCRSDNSCAGPNVRSSMGTGNISLYMNESKETMQLPTIKRHSSVIICPVCAAVSVTLAPSIRPKRKTSHGSVAALRPYIPCKNCRRCTLQKICFTHCFVYFHCISIIYLVYLQNIA